MRSRNNRLPQSFLKSELSKRIGQMRKLAFAALGLVTRMSRSLAALTLHEKTDSPVNRKRRKSPTARRGTRATAAGAKLR
jgi:hypothetical protein